jgi:hypothetical protein
MPKPQNPHPVDSINTQSIVINDAQILLLNLAVLIRVSRYTIVLVCEISTLHLSNETLVMSDHDELEVLLVLAVHDDLVQGSSESLDIISIEVCCWFVESDHLKSLLAFGHSTLTKITYSTAGTKRLRKSQPDDDTGKDSLASTAPTSHI